MNNFERKKEFLKQLISKPSDKFSFVKIKCLEHGWGKMELNHGVDSNSLNLYGKDMDSGIGIHAPGKIELELKGKYKRFTCFVGQEKNHITKNYRNNNLCYKFIGDEKELFSCGGHGKDYYEIDIDVTGINSLILVCDSPKYDYNLAHIAYGNIKLYTHNSVENITEIDFSKKTPYSFNYNGVSSDEFLYKWDYNCEEKSIKEGKNYLVTYKDPHSNLKYIIDVIEYEKDNAIWWDTYFENTSSENSGQISDIKVLDTYFGGYDNYYLNSLYGSNCQIDDFRPFSHKINNNPFELKTQNGRSTNYHCPYFNLSFDKKENKALKSLETDCPQNTFVEEIDLNVNRDAIVGALGWTGQWKGDFSLEFRETYCNMGLDDYVNFYLKPSEKVKVPSMVLVFTSGTFNEQQNDFRKYLVDYIIPKDEKGDYIKAPLIVSGWGGMRTSEYEKRLEAIKKHKLPYEYYWIDAGWYGPGETYDRTETDSKWSENVGNWYVNKFKHPKGLRYLSDLFAEAGMKFLLWVEIERAVAGSQAALEHPEIWLGETKENSNLCLNMADDKACDWAIETVGKIIEENNIKCYREDYNFDPLPYWKGQDEEKRYGITEIYAIKNAYRFWDTLIEKYGIIIDNCASGGRRLDINMAKRSFSFWRTDYVCFQNYDPIGVQTCQNWLSPWNINTCAGVGYWPGDTFRLRSAMGNGICFHFCSSEVYELTDDYPFDWHKKMMEDFLKVRDYFYGNYYSLLEAKIDHKAWISYEYFKEDINEGCVFVFREKDSSIKSVDLQLKGLKEGSIYNIEDLDTNEIITMTGKELMENGMAVNILNKYESKLYVIKEN